MADKLIKSSNAEEVQSELRDLSTRDLQLWSLGVLVFLVVVIGFVVMVLPNLMWKAAPLQVETRLLPQLVSGFLLLILLFNIYLLDQKRRLNLTRERLVRLLMADKVEDIRCLDPLTKVFNRSYLDTGMRHELDKATQSGYPLTVLLIDVKDFRRINRRYGAVAGDHLLLVLANVLKKTLRGSDVICRYGSDEFLLILPQTSTAQAECALQRIETAITEWNDAAHLNYTLAIQSGIAAHSAGCDLNELLNAVQAQIARAGDQTTLPEQPAEVAAWQTPDVASVGW